MGSIASGSSGNCILVGSEQGNVLVDVGISKKRIEEGLQRFDVSPKEVDGILITHEHSDHIQGLGVFTRKYAVPVYGTKETLRGILQCGKCGALDSDLFHEINADVPFTIKDMTINPFRISHDALNPVAYRIASEGREVAVATDMGTYDDYTISNLTGLDALLLEANHDVHMLEVGGYPYQLKRRILGNRGHLSNETSGKLLDRLLHNNLKKIFLGHLSKENNYDALAFETVRSEITLSDSPYKADDFDIEIAKRDTTSSLVLV
jgi:phosphoribosyl 1,2-cyclic phosphodiesterase